MSAGKAQQIIAIPSNNHTPGCIEPSVHFIFHHSTKINKNKQERNEKVQLHQQSFVFFKTPLLCQTPAQNCKVTPSKNKSINKHGHVRFSYTHRILLLYTNKFIRSHTHAVSFRNTVSFQFYKELRNKIQRDFDSFNLLLIFLSVLRLSKDYSMMQVKNGTICGLGQVIAGRQSPASGPNDIKPLRAPILYLTEKCKSILQCLNLSLNFTELSSPLHTHNAAQFICPSHCSGTNSVSSDQQALA